MIVGSLSGIPYAHYLVRMLPLGLLLLGLHIGVVLLLFRRELAVPLFRGDDPGLRRPRDPRLRAIALVCLGGTGLGFLLGGHLAWTAMIGATALLVVGPARDPRTAFADVDGRLLLFFAMLFVVVGGLKASGVTEAAFDGVAALLTGNGAQSIVVEGAAGHAHIGFRDYLRLGLPSTLLLLAAGTAGLLAYRGLGWIG